MNKFLLNVKNLNASIGAKNIIKNFNLKIGKNEIHAIMGPNGSGKSTFSKILAGHPSYEIKSGEITFFEKNLLRLAPETRSHEGIFLAFQSPPEIPGVSNFDFLRVAYNEKQKHFNLPEVGPLEFVEYVNKLINELKINEEFLNRHLNDGFSGGEKKRNEILQLLVLKPKLIILDEIDSGLDVDALKIICDILKKSLPKDSSLILITHYSRLLNYLNPNYVHIMQKGQIIKTGDMKLVDALEKFGYENIHQGQKF